MDDLQRLRAWSYAWGRSWASPLGSLGQALDAVVAVYATHPTAPLALWARTGPFTPARYRRFDRDRRGVRAPRDARPRGVLGPKEGERSTHLHCDSSLAGPAAASSYTARDFDGGIQRLAKKILAGAREPVSRKQLEAAVGTRGGELGEILLGGSASKGGY